MDHQVEPTLIIGTYCGRPPEQLLVGKYSVETTLSNKPERNLTTRKSPHWLAQLWGPVQPFRPMGVKRGLRVFALASHRYTPESSDEFQVASQQAFCYETSRLTKCDLYFCYQVCAFACSPGRPYSLPVPPYQIVQYHCSESVLGKITPSQARTLAAWHRGLGYEGYAGKH